MGLRARLGGLQVFPARYPVQRLLAETMRFFAEESCQKCTPCRIGNRALHHVSSTRASCAMTQEKLDEWLEALERRRRSAGSGQASPIPRAGSVPPHWPELMEGVRVRIGDGEVSFELTSTDGRSTRHGGRAARPRARAERRLRSHPLPRRQARSLRRLPRLRRRGRGRAATGARLRDPRRRGNGRLDQRPCRSSGGR